MLHVCSILFFLFVIGSRVAAFRGSSLKGEYQYCTQEGAQVKVPRSLVQGGNPCLVCFCKSHTVQCKALECPSVQGCYRVQKKRNNECCHTCLGCLHNSTVVAHRSTWLDKCSLHQCESGVLTSSNTQCYVPCQKPILQDENKCCPKCKGCLLDDQEIPEEGTGSPRHDPCVKCSCKDGHLSCKKKSCPVLSCPSYKAVLDEDECCYKCNGSRDHFALQKSRCFLGKHIYHSGSQRNFDSCTNCTCNHGFLTCKRQTCPVFQCPEEYRELKKGSCCPKCVYPKRSQVCFKDGVMREHGDVWTRDQCTKCSCEDGRTTCERTDQCEYAYKDCPPHLMKVKTESDCCPRCEEKPGICVSYGDPHYKTFDGYRYNFQGECRYELASDCLEKKFSIRVNNDARRSSYFSWTRSLSLKLTLGKEKYKISLGQKLKVKVNKQRIRKLPYSSANGLSITKNGYSLNVVTPLGLKLIWDGASYVEIEIDKMWRNRTCGLCGNFNRNATDDRLTKRGDWAEKDEDMANSWLSGRTSTCIRRIKAFKLKNPVKQSRFQRLSCISSPISYQSRCEILNHTYFDQCRTQVSSDEYYKSCLMDLCECPMGRMCQCDAMLAYQRECQQVGHNMTLWKHVSQCGGFECPYGAMYMTCAPACRPTCKNPRPNADCHMRRCKPGCFCPSPTVLHRGTCIMPDKCPKKHRKRKGRKNLKK